MHRCHHSRFCTPGRRRHLLHLLHHPVCIPHPQLPVLPCPPPLVTARAPARPRRTLRQPRPVIANAPRQPLPASNLQHPANCLPTTPHRTARLPRNRRIASHPHSKRAASPPARRAREGVVIARVDDKACLSTAPYIPPHIQGSHLIPLRSRRRARTLTHQPTTRQSMIASPPAIPRPRPRPRPRSSLAAPLRSA